ncbi:hypothetical protein [Geothrix sp. PMB-07]|uniref:hypothetical protein n=1 Tax=Geothrix sp. PMB-07 TaxID=3068640 RepID=UPI002741A443|nr:hypothetical protein [Geothrix sp. PMB-07]WLT32762.1 hypothetical protein Q9293_05370 [Geothrix sp. PMB-07]
MVQVVAGMVLMLVILTILEQAKILQTMAVQLGGIRIPALALLDPYTPWTLAYMGYNFNNATDLLTALGRAQGKNDTQIQATINSSIGTEIGRLLPIWKLTFATFGLSYRGLAELAMPGMGSVLGDDQGAREWIYNHELSHAAGTWHDENQTTEQRLCQFGVTHTFNGISGQPTISSDAYGLLEAAGRAAVRNGTLVKTELEKMANRCTNPALKVELNNFNATIPADC